MATSVPVSPCPPVPAAPCPSVPSNRARFEHLLPALALAAGVPGDYMELGVWRGDTFLPLARHAAERGCPAHAVDSFVGMLPPTAQDVDEHGCQQYPAGALSVGGPERLRELTAGLPNVRIHAGFIPEILRLVQVPAGLAFVHLDLDQHLPTRLALAWVWRHLNAGGVVACHDYWPGRGCLASRAIDEFLLTQGIAILGRDPKSSHAWFRKDPRP